MTTITGKTQANADLLRTTREGLFFIVGCGRSGTTLLQSMLISHPRVTIPPETKFYGVVRDQNRNLNLQSDQGFRTACEWTWANFDRRGIKIDKATFLDLADQTDRSWPGILTATLATYAVAQGSDRVGEKSPVHTHYAHEIMEDFPDAKFVHVLRDPRAVVLSRMKAGFGSRLIGPNIVRWRRAVDMHERCAQRLGPERYHIVRYEDLVQDRERVLKDLCEFLGIDLHPAMLAHHERDDRGWSERSSDWLENTLKPVFTSSIDAWKQDLKPFQIAMIEASLGDRITLMGYEPTNARARAPKLRVRISVFLGHIEEVVNKLGRGLRKALRKARPSSSRAPSA